MKNVLDKWINNKDFII